MPHSLTVVRAMSTLFKEKSRLDFRSPRWLPYTGNAPPSPAQLLPSHSTQPTTPRLRTPHSSFPVLELSHIMANEAFDTSVAPHFRHPLHQTIIVGHQPVGLGAQRAPPFPTCHGGPSRALRTIPPPRNGHPRRSAVHLPGRRVPVPRPRSITAP